MNNIKQKEYELFSALLNTEMMKNKKCFQSNLRKVYKQFNKHNVNKRKCPKCNEIFQNNAGFEYHVNIKRKSCIKNDNKENDDNNDNKKINDNFVKICKNKKDLTVEF